MENNFNKAEDFLRFLHQTYGLFLDASAAFSQFANHYSETQKKIAKRLFLSIDELDKKEHFYGNGDPRDKNSILLHNATQGEVKIRNREGGYNICWMGNFCLVLIYQFWEHEFREKIVLESGYKNKDKLKLNIMGEINKYRHSIIHNKGKTIREAKDNKILNWFKDGEDIMIDKEKMNIIIVEIISELKKLKDSNGNKLLTKNIFTSSRTHKSIFDVG